MKIFKPAAIIFSIIILFAEAFYLFVVPAIINAELKNNALEKIIKDYTGLYFTKDSFQVKTKPDFSLDIKASNIKISDKNKKNVFNTQKFELEVSILSLIFNRPNVKQFYMEKAALNCSMDEKGNLYFGRFKFVPRLRTEINLNRISAEIKNFDINFYPKSAGKNIKIYIASAKANKYVKDKFLDASVNAIIAAGKNYSEVQISTRTALPVKKHIENASFDGKIKNLDINAFSDFLKFYANNSLDSITGIINADFKTDIVNKRNNIYIHSQIENFHVNMKNKLDSVGSDTPLNINIEGQAYSDRLNLSKVLIGSKDWNMQVSGNVSKIEGKSAQLDLAVKIPKSALFPMYHLIPSLPDCNNAIQKLKKYGVWADVEAELKVKGNPDNPHIYGPVTLSDLYILKYDEKIPKCKIDMIFKGLQFDMYTKVFTRVNQFVEIKGSADNKLGGKGDFFVKSSPVVDLTTAHTLLLPVHDVVGFDLGPLPYMKLSGVGNIDIHTKGTVKDGYIDGVFNFKNTNAELAGLNTVLKNASGYLTFKAKDMHFETTSANIGRYPIKVTGNCDLLGNLNFDVFSDYIDTAELISIVKGSPDLKVQAKLLAPLEKLSGAASLKLNIKGFVKDFSKLIEKIHISGTLTLRNNIAKSIYSSVLAKNINGKVDFDGNDWWINATGYIFESKFYITAKSEKNKLWAALRSDALKIDNFLNSSVVTGEEAKNQKTFPQTNSLLELKAEYSGSADKIEYDKLKFSGHFKPTFNKDDAPFLIKSGNIELLKGDLTVKNFNAKIFNSTANLDAAIKSIFSKNALANYTLKIHNFDISSFDRLKNMRFMPVYFRKILNTYEHYSGHADVNITCKNNYQKGSIRLHEIKFFQKALSMPIALYSGDIFVEGNNISVKSLNAALDGNPVFMNVSLKDIKSRPVFNGYFTAKLTENFVNKYINNNLSYPIKPKGDITVTSEFFGDSKVINIKPKIKFNEGSDIYYMGANLGDSSDVREIKGDISVKDKIINLKKLSYIRYMTSQNGYTYPLEVINAAGKILKNKDSYILSPVRVNTLNSANVRLFNVFFKKSVLKQGMFNCNMTIWGNPAAPVITGNAIMTNLDMPLYDTIVKDVSVKFSKTNVNLKFKGQIFDSDFDVDAVIKNKVSLPVVIENVKINSNVLNLDTIINSMTRVTLSNITPSAGKIVENEANMNISDFVVKKGEMKADSVILRGLPASDYKAVFTLGEDAVLKVSDLGFNIAGGTVSGLAGYNLKNAKLYAELAAKDVDSNKIASAFLDVKDQIFGLLDGTAVISTSGMSEEERLRNMDGSVYFVIKDGRMPKLGSIEYLIKAGNFIKSGVTGLSINNFIDLIAPVKTGYFNSIKGLISLKNGKAQNLEIYSSGDTLSLFIKGQFDFPEQNADLTVFGRLTKKADNILGVVGNASFNSLLNLIPGFRLDSEDKKKIVKDLNKIPGVEFNDRSYRMFSAKINGDINGEKYVKSFKWIE